MTAVDPTAGTGNNALEAALAYANHGLRVIPIGPGTKHPPLEAWQDKATTNPETIRLWWRNNPRYGVGIATGLYDHRWLFCVDIDNGVDPRTGRVKEGDDSLHDLETEHGPLPDTMEGQSGSGGRHLWYWSDVEITNDQAGRLGVDLDIRGVGGQIVCHPTIHPVTGRAYQWVDSKAPDETPIAPAPRWLIDLLTTPTATQPRTTTVPYDGPERPGDRLRWVDILTGNGATYIGTRRDHKTGSSYELWARPGADHTSATLYYAGTDLLKVFTPNWPGLEQGATYTRFGFYAAVNHEGDHRKAAAELARLERDTDNYEDLICGPATDSGLPGDDQPDDPLPDDDGTARKGNWRPADLAAALAAGLTRPEPEYLIRDDGKALFYPGKTHTVFGESGAGKTWLMYIAAAQQIAQGCHVIILDWEDDEIAYLSRMIALGIPGELVVANSTYYPIGAAATVDDLEEIDRLIAEHQTVFIGIDSTGEAIAAQGMDQDKDPDVAKWMGALPRRWARLGVCVVMLDHMPHAGGREIGSQRKRAGISGAAYEAIATQPFSREQAGILTIKVAKDRGGNYAKGTEQAVVEFNPENDGLVMRYVVRAGSGRAVSSNSKSAGEYMDAIVEFLEQQTKPVSTRALRDGVPGDNKNIDAALSLLVKARKVLKTPQGQGIYYALNTTKDNETL